MGTGEGPIWITWALLGLMGAITLVRVTRVRSSVLDRMMNSVMLLGTTSMVLHEKAIADHVAPLVPGGMPTVWDIWHFLFCLGCVVGAGIWIMRKYGSERYRRPYRALLTATWLIGAAFVVLSTPARQHHLANITEVGGWRYGAYFLLYGMLLVSLCLWMMRPTVEMLRHATSRREYLVALVVLVVVLILGTVNTVVIAGGALLDAADVDSVVTRLGRASTSGSTLLPIAATASLTLLPSTIRALAQLTRLDSDSRLTRQLRPIWLTMTAAVPTVVLRLTWLDRLGITPRERLHRTIVEIIDATSIVGGYVEPLPDTVDNLIEDTVPIEDQEDVRSVAEIATAAKRLAALGGYRNAGEPAQPGHPVPSVRTLHRLWPQAQRLLATSVVEHQRTKIQAQD